MDILSILGVAGTVVAGGVGTFLATAGVKAIKAIPINEGQTTKIRSVAAVFSVLAVSLTALASGNLAPENLQDLVGRILEAVAIFVTAHSVHKATKG